MVPGVSVFPAFEWAVKESQQEKEDTGFQPAVPGCLFLEAVGISEQKEPGSSRNETPGCCLMVPEKGWERKEESPCILPEKKAGFCPWKYETEPGWFSE